MLQNVRVSDEQKRQPSQGKRVLAALREQGIEAGNVIRDRRSGIYAVKFGAPNPNHFNGRGTDPAQVWANRIQSSFEDVEIVGTYDSVADWRPQKPVLFATVFIRLKSRSA